MVPQPVIDRCTCFDRTFAEIKAAMPESTTTLEAITKRFGCGGDCGICRPYLAQMLKTGETVFTEILIREDLEPPAPRCTGSQDSKKCARG